MTADAFGVRGVVEGFYGTPWTWDARQLVIETLAAFGANAYVYAPKDDHRHRQAWREPYPAVEMDCFAALAATCDGVGVQFGFAISPGVDIDYDDPADIAALIAKLTPFHALTKWFVLALDDIRPREGLGTAHATLTARLLDEFPDARLSLVPTDYVGTDTSPYLAQLAAGLPAGVDVMWTGRTVCSPTITAVEAEARAAAVGDRLPLLWDNYPVNDALMSNSLHLAPYTGRDPKLATTTAGVLLNPMVQARASLVPLVTACRFLADPDSYDQESAWNEALSLSGRERAAAWRALGEACWSSPLHPPSTVPFAELVAEGSDVDALLAVADAAAGLGETLAGDPAAAEVQPWVEQIECEAAVIRAAAQLLAVARTDPLDRGRALHRSFVLIALWSRARSGSRVAFGPRFAAYPAITGNMTDGRLDVAGAVVEDASAVDRLARLALSTYEAVA